MPIFSLESEDFFEKLKDLNKHLNHPLKSDPTRTKLTQKRFTLYQFIATMSLIEINKEVAPTLPLMSKISECSSEAAKFYTLACRAAIVTEIIKISEGNQDLRFHTTGIADIANQVDDDGSKITGMVAAANPLDLTDSKRIFLNHIDFLEFAKNVEACSLNGARPYAQAMALAVKNNLSRSICELELLEKSVATFSSLKFMNAKGQISAASTKVAKPAAAPAAPEVDDSPSKSSQKNKTSRIEIP